MNINFSTTCQVFHNPAEYLYVSHVGLHHVQTILVYEALDEPDALLVGCHLGLQVAQVVMEIACSTAARVTGRVVES